MNKKFKYSGKLYSPFLIGAKKESRAQVIVAIQIADRLRRLITTDSASSQIRFNYADAGEDSRILFPNARVNILQDMRD